MDAILSKRKFHLPGSTSDKPKTKINDPETGVGQCDETGQRWGDWVGFSKVVRNDSTMSDAGLFVAEVIGFNVSDEPKQKASSKREVSPAGKMPKSLELLSWNSQLIAIYLQRIGLDPASQSKLKEMGFEFARYTVYRRKFTVLAVPIWGPNGSQDLPVNWIAVSLNGAELPTRDDGPVGKKAIGGNARGIIGDIREIDRMIAGEKRGSIAIKTEGISDLFAALLRDDKPAGMVIWTNPFGCRDVRQTHEKAKWSIDVFEGMESWVLHDSDQPGQKGAIGESLGADPKSIGWCQRLAEVSSSVRNVPLPYEVEKSHGKDLRDFFADGHSFADVLAIAKDSPVILPPKQLIDELEDLEANEDPYDPARLARVNVNRYATEQNGQLAFWHGCWWRHKRGRWERMSDTGIDAKVRIGINQELIRIIDAEIAADDDGENKKPKKKKKISNTLVRDVLSAMQSECFVADRIEMPSWLDSTSKSTNYVAMNNGLLDVGAIIAGDPQETWLVEHNSNWFSGVFLEYNFDPNAISPTLERYLASSLPDENAQSLLQEWAGYLLVARNPMQKFLACEGDGGTGKSVAAAIFTAMLSEASVSNAELREFGTRFGLSDTIGKALNIDGDVQRDAKFSEGSFKKFSIGERMSFEFKNATPFSHLPTAKLMLLWNERPKISDSSNGMWRRMLLVPFEHVVQERVLGMDQSSWWLQSGEMPGVLNWAIEGLQRLFQQQSFTESEAMKSLIREYRKDENPIHGFIEEHVRRWDSKCDWNKDHFTSTRELADAFRGWCEENASPSDAESMTNKKMGWAIRKKFNELKSGEKNTIEYGHARGYYGIKILTPEEIEIEKNPPLEQGQFNEFL